jgi:hypothetical protein
METAAGAILEMGAESVLLKGGHLDGEPVDILATSSGLFRFPGRRIVPGKVHGTGCTLASACATLIAGGYGAEEAVPRALCYLKTALRDNFRRTHGTLLGHFPSMGPLPSEETRKPFTEAQDSVHPVQLPLWFPNPIRSVENAGWSITGILFRR